MSGATIVVARFRALIIFVVDAVAHRAIVAMAPWP